jgi:hypothetical protein
MTYKFPRIVLKPGAATVVWSMDTDVTHQAPDTLKMKERWTAGKQMKTVLVNPNAEEVAWFQLDRDVVTKTTMVESMREGGEELFHQGVSLVFRNSVVSFCRRRSLLVI